MSSKIKIKYPLGIQWKIAETRLQELRNSINGCLDSNIFEIPDTDIKYLLSIYPNGVDNSGKTYIFLFFVLLDFEEKKDIEAEYSVSIDSANYSKKESHVFTECDTWGETICTTDEFFDPKNRYIVDGELEIRLEGYIIFEKEAPVANLFQLDCSGHRLSIDLWNQEFKDFTIVTEGKEITAHKNVLSARSPVFKAMFQPHTLEAQENKVIISDFPFDIVEAAIKFCYDSSLVGNVSFEDQISLLQFFDKYDIKELKMDLEKHLISQITELNVCRLANASIISNSLDLGFKCFKFLQNCMKNGKPVNDLKILDKDFAIDLLQSSMLNISL